MHPVALVYTLTVGFTLALLFGLITQRVKLSPIVGYLLAGLAVGPGTPGFIADAALASQLAEVGVILLMFNVGLHFKMHDLLKVKFVAIPGAIIQIVLATFLGAWVLHKFGFELRSSIVLGLSLSVASTVVLVRVLVDNELLTAHSGRIAVGWLIVEDILMVFALIILPAMGRTPSQAERDLATTVAIAVLKLALMIPLILLGGSKLIPWVFSLVAKARSRELFIVAVLAVALGIATGATVIFGASLALGAFLSGVIVGQSDVHHQAAADALPMRDAFAVLFFVSIGMLLDPRYFIEYPGLILATTGVIVLGKSIIALLLTLLLGESVKTALVVAFGLAQIGEFSFIMAETARSEGLLSIHGSNVLIASAMLSIALNPLIFRSREGIERLLRVNAVIWRWLNYRRRTDHALPTTEVQGEEGTAHGIIVGFGPVGQTLAEILQNAAIRPTIIDLNLDTVRRLRAEGRSAIYGDASTRAILEAAKINSAGYLLVTLPDLPGRMAVIATARILNPELIIITRARYLGERAMLEDAGANVIAYEEAEVAQALSEKLRRQLGYDTIYSRFEGERNQAR